MCALLYGCFTFTHPGEASPAWQDRRDAIYKGQKYSLNLFRVLQAFNAVSVSQLHKFTELVYYANDGYD